VRNKHILEQSLQRKKQISKCKIKENIQHQLQLQRWLISPESVTSALYRAIGAGFHNFDF